MPRVEDSDCFSSTLHFRPCFEHLPLFLTRHGSQREDVRETYGGERGGQGCQHDHQLLHRQGKYMSRRAEQNAYFGEKKFFFDAK